MIYRLLVDYPDPHNVLLDHLVRLVGRAVPIPWNKRVARRLAGGSFGPLALIMFQQGLRSLRSATAAPASISPSAAGPRSGVTSPRRRAGAATW